MGTRDPARAQRLPAVWCLAAAALFGASTPAAKTLLGSLGPFTLAGLLYLGAAAGVLPAARLARLHRPHRSNLLRLGGAVVSGGVLAPVLLLLGLSRAPAASVALWLNLEMVATAVLAWALFREHMSARAWLAGVTILAASFLLAAPAGLGTLSAAALVALACTLWGLDNNFTALIDGFSPAQTTFFKGLVAGAVNLWIGAALEGPLPAPHLVLGAAAIGAAGYGLSLILYIAGAQQLGAARSQMLFATGPFWSVVLAWTLFAEARLPEQVLAGLLMVAALWLVQGERHEHAHAHAPVTHVHWHRHDDGHHTHVHHGLPASTWHSHEHAHEEVTHAHPHRPDLHHRHGHERRGRPHNTGESGEEPR